MQNVLSFILMHLFESVVTTKTYVFIFLFTCKFFNIYIYTQMKKMEVLSVTNDEKIISKRILLQMDYNETSNVSF